ncbi:MAG: peptidase M24 [Candidatus Cloacimonadota bacterium]|nr:MAG: peptidase M24 [Candidatus Cloacimonadota bacterium]
MNVKEKIIALRKEMKKRRINAWIIPSSDPHQSEYVAPCWKAREWLSGFSGSAGTVVVTTDEAGLWTDSRYYIQAASELKDSGIKLYKFGLEGVPSYTRYLSEKFKETEKPIIGFDGKLLSVNQVKELKKSLEKAEFFCREDLMDIIWTERPPVPNGEVLRLSEKYTGESTVSKLKRIREKMAEYKVNVHIVTSLDDIAWTFNIRGKDIAYNPVVISYSVITDKEAILFVNSSKLPEEVKKSLTEDKVILKEYNEFYEYLPKLKNNSVLIDPAFCNQKIKESIEKDCNLKEKRTISVLMKSIKNEVELEGMRQAHIQDGIAMVRWMCWLDENIGKTFHDEITIADKLEEFRSKGDKFMGLSFNTISGYGENGALCHYSAQKESAAEIKPEGMLLVDSGGQYLNGTTDITRTMTTGNPSAEQKRDYTSVLKGHIRLAKLKFPKGYTGGQLDTATRAALWERGLNYLHGTGHGVGHFLAVHEGPQSISGRSTEPLQVGMCTSNEPGLYHEGKYGIRIETIIITMPYMKTEYGEFFQFETITLCPMDLDLTEAEMLDKDEIRWLNDYHKTVFEKLSPFLNEKEKAWLKHETREIK